MQKSSIFAVSSVAVTAILLVSGCSNNQAQEATPSESSATTSSSSASSSASAASSAPASEESKAAESAEATEAGTPSEAPAENYAGAEQLASASAVPLSQEDVVTTQNLYTSYQEVLSNIGTVEVVSDEGDSPSEDEATSEESGLNKPNLALDEATESSINSVATGGANDEFASTALEYANNGWIQEGKSTIVGDPKVTDTEFAGQPAKALEVCVDSSDVKVKDSAGNTLTNSNVPHRSLNIFTLVEDNGTWKIASHDFPNNPDC